MNITKGFWRTRDGRKAHVVDIGSEVAIGWINNCPHNWYLTCFSTGSPHCDLIEPWIDKPEWDWSTTPPWLNYLAMDEGEFWYLYENKPKLCRSVFKSSNPNDYIWLIPPQYAPKWTGDWKDSLISRPGI